MEARLEKALKSESVGVQAAYKYLSNKSVTLWGDYIISDPWRRLDAARWLDTQRRAVNNIIRKGEWR